MNYKMFTRLKQLFFLRKYYSPVEERNQNALNEGMKTLQ